MREQINNLEGFISKNKEEFLRRLEGFGAAGLISWSDAVWNCGPQGVAWFRDSKRQALVFSEIEGVSGIEHTPIDATYSEFMKAVLITEIFCINKIPSNAAIYKRLNILRRWYFEMVNLTGQVHPMYLNAEIIHAAMKRHYEHSKSPSNVSDYCDMAVGLTKILRPLNLTILPLNCENKYPKRNVVRNTKARKAADTNPDSTDDSKLISIRAFMSIIEMTYLAKTDSEKIFLNFILLLVVTGFRFQEAQSLKLCALVKREMNDKDKLEHARQHGLPEYYLGIKYLGAKKAGWRTHWLAPSTNALVESIFDVVKMLTQNSRRRLKQYRDSNFTDLLPLQIKSEFVDDLIELSCLEGNIFLGSGGTRKHAGLRRSMMDALAGKKINIHPVSIDESNPTRKKFYFTRGQLNRFVSLRYSKNHAFIKGMECKLVITNEGIQNAINYEDLLFIAPDGAFGFSNDLIVLTNPEPFDHAIIHAWLGGNDKRQSFFEKLGLVEDDGGRISMGTHFPRHNINTFFAIAGVTDHLQAMLMGRMDITQNAYYQHQADSFSYQAASMAVMALEKKSNEDKESPIASLKKRSLLPTVSFRSHVDAVAKHLVKTSALETIKRSNSLLVDKHLSSESNLKQNLHSIGESRSEVARYIQDTMSDSFMSELKEAHTALLSLSKEQLAADLIERHAKLHAMPMGSCTRDVVIFGCPFAMKCQSGEPCGYFTLTGRIDELAVVRSKLAAKKEEVKKLAALCEMDSSFEVSLHAQEEALLILESLHNKVVTSLSDRKIVSILSQDESNPLSAIVKRIYAQKVIGKTPRTLADMFFIEQKRIERSNSQLGVNYD